MATAEAEARSADTAPETRDLDDATPVQRKLIQTAELHVQVDSYASARTAIERDLSEMGGFIADVQVEHRDGSVSYADITVRIPSERLADFLAGTAGAGDVVHETVRSQDITEGYYDTQAHLKNAKRMEARLLSLLDEKADTVTALLEVERELARVRGQIESLEGKIRLWDSQVSLSTVKLRLVTRQVYALSQPPTVMQRLEGALGGSFAALQSFGLGLLVMLVALIPWLVPLGLAGFAVAALVRRVRRRRQHAPSAGPMPNTV